MSGEGCPGLWRSRVPHKAKAFSIAMKIAEESERARGESSRKRTLEFFPSRLIKATEAVGEEESRARIFMPQDGATRWFASPRKLG